MPDGAVYVGRPTKWGNPWNVNRVELLVLEPQIAVEWYSRLLQWAMIADRDLAELRGRDLACWCPLDQPCHADVLLQMANAQTINKRPFPGAWCDECEEVHEFGTKPLPCGWNQ